MAKTAAERKREQRARQRAAKGLAPAGQQPVTCAVCGAEVVGRLGQQWCSPRCRQRAKRLGADKLGNELVQAKVAALERARLGPDALRPEQLVQAQQWDRHVMASWQRAQMNADAQAAAERLLHEQGLTVTQWLESQGLDPDLTGCALHNAVENWLMEEGLWEEED